MKPDSQNDVRTEILNLVAFYEIDDLEELLSAARDAFAGYHGLPDAIPKVTHGRCSEGQCRRAFMEDTRECLREFTRELNKIPPETLGERYAVD